MFGATVKSTRPGPVPLEPLVIVIQLLAVAAVHEQPAAAFTVTALVPPDEDAAYVPGLTLNWHPDAWSTAMMVLATLKVPVRDGVSVASTRKVTTPEPLPVFRPVTTIHGMDVSALQAHPVGAVTRTSPVPPPAPKLKEAGATEKVHGTTASAFCSTPT